MMHDVNRRPAIRRAAIRRAALLAAAVTWALAVPPATALDTPVVLVHPGDDLAARVAASRRGEILRLAPGHYHLEPVDYTDPACGNCEDPATPVPATLGMRLSGVRVRLVGAGADSTVIHTHAGYGVLVEDCQGCRIDSLTVTDGARDPDGRATDAAIVVRRSSVTVLDCRIADNIGDPAVIDSVVVGVIGIAGREGAELTAGRNRIERNSWDGIALYRGATAHIEANVIDGVDAARGREAGGGRGVGIGVTWDAQATIRGNLVRNYWKGIGTFVDARTLIASNVVEEILTWGISLWDAGKGRPSAVIENNVIDHTGACGVSIVRTLDGPPPPGRLTGNIIMRTGQDPRYDDGEPYCMQTAIARHDVPESFEIAGNVLFRNREPGDQPGGEDVADETAFEVAAERLLERLVRRPTLLEARFFRSRRQEDGRR